MENEQVWAGRDDRTCLARPNLQARAETGKQHVSCLGDHEQDWQPYLIDPYSAIRADHTYLVHTYTSSTNEGGTLLTTHVLTLSVAEQKKK